MKSVEIRIQGSELQIRRWMQYFNARFKLADVSELLENSNPQKFRVYFQANITEEQEKMS